LGRLELAVAAAAKRLDRERDIGVDVESPFDVSREEGIVAAPEFRLVDPPQRDHELAPGVVRIDRQQGVIEVEQAQVQAPPSSASICLSSGTVIARLVAREKASRRSSCAIRCLRSRAKRVSTKSITSSERKVPRRSASRR